LNQYEAMFLFDPTFASDFGAVKAEIERLLARAEAEIVFLEKWEERKLAYEIKGRKRGLYVLTYFKCDGAKIAPLERDARLSEPILRILVKNANGVTREQIERFMPQARRADESTREGSGDGKPAGQVRPGTSRCDSARRRERERRDPGTGSGRFRGCCRRRIGACGSGEARVARTEQLAAVLERSFDF
jgi:small subunit ribosomal protein S6